MTTALSISFAALWVLVIFQTLVLLGLTRSLHQLQQTGIPADDEDDGIEGQPLPDFGEVTLSGDTVDNESIKGRLTALLFVSPDCSTCSVTLDELELLNAKTSGSIVVFCRSSEKRCRELAGTYRLELPVIVDEGLQLSRRFGVAGTPTAVLVGPDGHVQSYGQPMSGEDLESAIENADGQHRVSAEELEPVVISDDGEAKAAT